MTGLEVVGAVAAVISAFHGGAELVSHIRKKHRKRKSLQEIQEKRLEDALHTGETLVSRQYAADLKVMGELVRIGDAIARDQLLHITVVMQAEIIRSLQLAVKYDNAIINLNILLDSSIMYRNDCITTLSELKQRMSLTRSLDRTLTDPLDDIARSPMDGWDAAPMARAPSLQTAPDDYNPTAEPLESNNELARYLSEQKNNSHSSTSDSQRHLSSASSINFSPALNYLLQKSENSGSIMKDIDEIISSYQSLNFDHDKSDPLRDHDGGGSNRDTLAVLMGGGVAPRDTWSLNRDAMNLLKNLPPTPEEGDHDGNQEYPALNHDIFDKQYAYDQYYDKPMPATPPRRGSRNSRLSTGSSVYSDTVPPSLYSGSNSPGPSDYTPRTSVTTSITAPRPHHAMPQRPSSPSLFPPFRPQSRDPTALSSLSFVPPLAQAARPRTPLRDDDGTLTLGRTRVLTVPDQDATMPAISALVSAAAPAIQPVPEQKLAHVNSYGSSTASIRSNTIQGPSAAQEKAMDGRPCKANSYWGFCKGAWAVREDLKRGLSVQVRPGGMYNTTQLWQCKHCYFQGNAKSELTPGKKKKETAIDSSIYTSAVGIRYRWLFLAKSHVKKKNMDTVRGPIQPEKEDCNYGCVICSVEGNVTGIFGNVETLMNHIFLEHARSMTEKMAAKAKVVMGREAGANEEWDLNIPMMNVLSV